MRLKRYILSFVFLLLLAANTMRAQETDYKAYSLFIYNFMKYIEWPDQQSKGDFVVGMLGDSPLSKDLQVLAASKKIKGRSIVVKKITTPEEASTCQLVFIPDQKSSMVKQVRDATRDRSVLIVAEREGLARKGAAMSFVTMEDDELKFDINRRDIEQRNLKISSQLVTLGIPVN